mmetsp:Transcript_109442/g.274141  ORF Transcript_109442/g.274141 Transcript_109442/m.274141 type:complete len:83 (+) Transcript_109442:144-392(+)
MHLIKAGSVTHKRRRQAGAGKAADRILQRRHPCVSLPLESSVAALSTKVYNTLGGPSCMSGENNPLCTGMRIASQAPKASAR